MLITLYLTTKKTDKKGGKNIKNLHTKRGKKRKVLCRFSKSGIILRQANGCLTRMLFKKVGSAN